MKKSVFFSLFISILFYIADCWHHDIENDISDDDIAEKYKPYLTKLPEKRYLEVFVLVDHELFRRFGGDVEFTHKEVMRVFEAVDRAYSKININVVLVDVVIETVASSWQRSYYDADSDLIQFKIYCQNLQNKAMYGIHRFDAGIFLSHRQWGATQGNAYGSNMCNHLSRATVYYGDDFKKNVWKIGHEIGHLLNMAHSDGTGCKCLSAPNACFLRHPQPTTYPDIPGFFDCNMDDYSSKSYTCLDNKPEKIFKPSESSSQFPEAWSSWSKCSVNLCSGSHTRRRCTSNQTQCSESEPCECTTTKITTPKHSYNSCLVPATEGCSVKDKTMLVITATKSRCEKEEALFQYDTKTGFLVHKCSGKPVCSRNNKVFPWNDIVIDGNCEGQNFMRTFWSTLSVGRCIHEDIKLSNGDFILRLGSRSCDNNQDKFVFDKVPQGPVKAELFDGEIGLDYNIFNGFPSHTSYVDHLDTPITHKDFYGAKISSYFVAPLTGYYVFVAACDDECRIYLSPSSNPSEKKLIIDAGYAPRYEWDRDVAQSSEVQHLKAGSKYYIEGLLIEKTGWDYISIGAYLPDGTKLLPITNEHLSTSGDETEDNNERKYDDDVNNFDTNDDGTTDLLDAFLNKILDDVNYFHDNK